LPNGAADIELAEGLAAGVIPRCLSGNGEGLSDTAMTELPKMPCEVSHDIFEKLCRISSPCHSHASQAPSGVPLLLVLPNLLWEVSAAFLTYIA
jgi:hypothetical protein